MGLEEGWSTNTSSICGFPLRGRLVDQPFLHILQNRLSKLLSCSGSDAKKVSVPAKTVKDTSRPTI